MLAFDPTYGQWARRRLRTRPQQTLGKLRAFAEYCEAECTRRGLGDVDGELEDEDDEDDEDGEDEDEDEDETDGVASARNFRVSRRSGLPSVSLNVSRVCLACV